MSLLKGFSLLRPNLINVKQNLPKSTIITPRRTLFNRISVHEKHSAMWYWDVAIVFGVFAITGSSSVYITRPIMNKVFGLEGNWRDGPWSYRIASIFIGLPAYSLMLLTFGTLSGRGAYFYPVVKRMWSRFIPKKVSQSLFK